MADQTLVQETRTTTTDIAVTLVSGVIDVTCDGPTLSLKGAGAGWFASGTTIVLKPEATQPLPVRYELLASIQTSGYTFGDPAARVFPLNGNPNMAFGFERSLETTAPLVFVNSIPKSGLPQAFEMLFDIRESTNTGSMAAVRLELDEDPTVVFEPPGG